ncbi:murE1 [Symbiodinium sp. CCMP2456]|nr:murE1 [Symbiodinium sp. CCMP2456]
MAEIRIQWRRGWSPLHPLRQWPKVSIGNGAYTATGSELSRVPCFRAIGGLGAVVFLHRRRGCRLHLRPLSRKLSETAEMPREESPNPADFTADIENIESQIRSLDRIRGQAAGTSFPPKSTKSGLSALNDLETLADSTQLAEGSLLLKGNTGTNALVASILEESHDNPEAENLVLLNLFEDLHCDEPQILKVPENIAHQLDQRTSEDEKLLALPLPCNDESENAQSARVPVAAAISEISRSGASLGKSEALFHSNIPSTTISTASAPISMPLAELLEMCDYSSAPLFGEGGVSITGVVDVAQRATKGDFLLLTSSAAAHDGVLLEQLFEQGMSAIGLLAESDMSREEAGKLFSRFSDKGLQAVVLLSSGLPSPAHRLAEAFYASSRARAPMQLIGVIGGQEYDVRTTAWLLFKLLESAKGPAKTGLLSDRRCMIAFQSKDVGDSLTCCAIQELLAEMSGAGVGACVVEIPPGASAFQEVDFDVLVDLGQTRDAPAAEVLRQRCLQTSKAVVVGPHECADSLRAGSSLATYSVEVSSFEGVKTTPTKAQIVEKLKDLGVDDIPAGAKKAELVKMLEELLPSGDAVETTSSAPLSPASLNCLCGRTMPTPSMRQCHVELTGWGLELGLNLPLLKDSSPAAVAALCAAGAILRCDDPLTDIQGLAARLEAINPPPGTFEIFSSEDMHDSAVLLHEAASPLDVEQALQVTRSSMAHAPNMQTQLTAVFGCDGEVSRGDRAKFGWALAACDKLILTSASPRGEPPMQILEDILEAVKQQRSCLELDWKAPLEVHVVADRADAIKLATLLNRNQPNLQLAQASLVFGSSYDDGCDAADQEGAIRTWLCNDRKIIADSLHLAEGLNSSSLEDDQMPWGIRRDGPLYPGRSLHWSYAVGVSVEDQVVERL